MSEQNEFDPKCMTCKKEGPFYPCNCGHSHVWGCEGRGTCSKCDRAHTTIGALIWDLKKTQCAERSNSRRKLLFDVLWNAVIKNRTGLGTGDERYVIDLLRDCNPFTHDESQFQTTINLVAKMITPTQEFAASIRKGLERVEIERAAERRASRANFAAEAWFLLQEEANDD